MTDLKRLLDAAPQRVRNCTTHHGCDCREYVMERVPDLLAAVEVLERIEGAANALLWEVADNLPPSDERRALSSAITEARAVLRRLREAAGE